jgi:hypothetical protein
MVRSRTGERPDFQSPHEYQPLVTIASASVQHEASHTGSVALRNLDDVDTLLAVVITYFNTTGSVSVELNFLIATEPQFTSASNWCQMTVPGRSSSRMNARVFFRCFPIFAA